MRVNTETLQMRIKRLKGLLADIPEDLSELPEDIRHILNTGPQPLVDMETALKQIHEPDLLRATHEVLTQIEGSIEWAVGAAKGQDIAQNIRTGNEPHPATPSYKRLNQRITQFLSAQVNGEQYLELIKEFCGDDAVQGHTVYMDPTGESEAFSQWMLHDKRLPVQRRRLIELFAEEFLGKIPLDEQALLKSRLQDRPSIYRATKFQKDRKTGKRRATYLVEDLLSAKEVIRIQDRSTSKTLHHGAIFIGRAIPLEGDRFFNLLGSISELSFPIWAQLSVKVEVWTKEHNSQNPGSSSHDFFRAYHSKIRRFVYQ